MLVLLAELFAVEFGLAARPCVEHLLVVSLACKGGYRVEAGARDGVVDLGGERRQVADSHALSDEQHNAVVFAAVHSGRRGCKPVQQVRNLAASTHRVDVTVRAELHAQNRPMSAVRRSGAIVTNQALSPLSEPILWFWNHRRS